jgi:acetyl-CoA carboxylase biotin carboxyl carrier protein
VAASSDDQTSQVLKEARDLVKMLESTSVRRVVLETGGFKIDIERAVGAGPPAAAAAAPPVAAAAAPRDTRHRVLAPLVGTFYRAASPGAKPFVEVGTRVQRGQAIGIIEAMKIMNEVASDAAGVVTELLVDNGQPVQFEQPLVVIDPAG